MHPVAGGAGDLTLFVFADVPVGQLIHGGVTVETLLILLGDRRCRFLAEIHQHLAELVLHFLGGFVRCILIGGITVAALAAVGISSPLPNLRVRVSIHECLGLILMAVFACFDGLIIEHTECRTAHADPKKHSSCSE